MAATNLLLSAPVLGPVISFLGTQISRPPPGPIPISVNYFPSRECNKACGFCFHTATNSYMASQEDAKRGLRKLRQAGMKKLNIAGGEPFLHPKFIGELCRYGKEELGLESISIVSNGSKIRENWLVKFGKYLDILAISCDSFNEESNIKIGRGNGNNVAELRNIQKWCLKYGIMFKLNTVVCRYNFDEDMAAQVAELNPVRWKVFQVLKVQGENDGERTDGKDILRSAAGFEISDEDYELFCEKHKHLPCFVPESNEIMSQSYILMDERLRFVDGKDKNIISESILDVDVMDALKQVPWDYAAFEKRGGVYEWSKTELPESGGVGCEGASGKEFDW
ncbi:unnamed protein product [Discula destructiva]